MSRWSPATIIKSIINVFLVNGNYLIIFLVAIAYIIGINKKVNFHVLLVKKNKKHPCAIFDMDLAEPFFANPF